MAKQINFILEMMNKIDSSFIRESIDEIVYDKIIDDDGNVSYVDRETGEADNLPYYDEEEAWINRDKDKELEKQGVKLDKDRYMHIRGEQQFNKRSNSLDVLIEIDRYSKGIEDLKKYEIARIFNEHLRDRDIEILSYSEIDRLFRENEKYSKAKDPEELRKMAGLMYRTISSKSTGKLGNVIELFYGKPGDNKSNPDFGSGTGEYGDAVEAKSIFTDSKSGVIRFSQINIGHNIGITTYEPNGESSFFEAEPGDESSKRGLKHMMSFPQKLTGEFFDRASEASVSLSIRKNRELSTVLKLENTEKTKEFIEYANVKYTKEGIEIDVFGNFVNKEMNAVNDAREDYKILSISVKFNDIAGRLKHKMSRTFTVHGSVAQFVNGRPVSRKNRDKLGELSDESNTEYFVHLQYATIGVLKRNVQTHSAKVVSELIANGVLQMSFAFVYPHRTRQSNDYGGLYLAFSANYLNFDMMFDEKPIDAKLIAQLKQEEDVNSLSGEIDDKMGGVYESKTRKKRG